MIQSERLSLLLWQLADCFGDQDDHLGLKGLTESIIIFPNMICEYIFAQPFVGADRLQAY
jgi:hypothetical protein